jgi:hypothetical protein
VKALFRGAILLLMGLAFAAQAATQLEIIELHNRPAAEIIPLVQPFVGPEGTVTGQGYKLIVKATPANMAEVKKIVASLDAAKQQLVISVSQTRQRTDSHEGAGVGGRITSGDVSVKTAPPPGRGGVSIIAGDDDSKVKARIYSTKERDDSGGVQRIRTQEGEPAFIQVGQAIPLPQRSVTHGVYGTTVQDSVEYKSVTTGFYVIALVSGDNVTLKISPQQERLSREGGGRIDVSRAHTSVRGKLGEWIDIGGASQQTIGNASGTVYSTQDRSRLNQSIWLKVDAVE